MKLHRLFIPLLLIVAVAGCRSASAPAPHAATLDQEIQLAPNEQALYAAQGLAVQFIRVVEDSRCPTDVTCVWAGEVKLQVSTRINDAAATQHEITTAQPATIGAFRLNVVQVQPDRVSTREISPEEYRVTLKVEQPSG